VFKECVGSRPVAEATAGGPGANLGAGAGIVEVVFAGGHGRRLLHPISAEGIPEVASTPRVP
jgi:hypothetical protein